LAEVVLRLTHSNVGIRYIGAYRGEKKYETLVTAEEQEHAEDLGDFFRLSAAYERENLSISSKEPYTSQRTTQLDVEAMCQWLKKLALFGGPIKQHG
jgi:UDP-glucose 4-epimerase